MVSDAAQSYAVASSSPTVVAAAASSPTSTSCLGPTNSKTATTFNGVSNVKKDDDDDEKAAFHNRLLLVAEDEFRDPDRGGEASGCVGAGVLVGPNKVAAAKILFAMEGDKIECAETPPKHPWDQQQQQQQQQSHQVLTPQYSYPEVAPVGKQNQYPMLGAHLPISRTVSDSYPLPRTRVATGGDNVRTKAAATSSFVSSRRKLESEDSSYDSDHDNTGGHDYYYVKKPPHLPLVQVSRSHDDVSRTPSETLKEEFLEHITVRKYSQQQQDQQQRSRDSSPGLTSAFSEQQSDPTIADLENVLRDPAYNAKVEFALRLGYSESMLQRALFKLGHGAGQNQILEELIRLQKSKPGQAVADEEDTTRAAELALAFQEPLDLRWLSLNEQHSQQQTSGDYRAGKARDECDLLPVVIDGSNVAMSHGNKDVFSCKGIRICVNWFVSRGHKDITVFVPRWRKESSRPDTPISDQSILTELEKDRLLFFTPSRQVRGRRFVCHDDRYILNLAADTGAIVVSNDNYRDLINEKPEFKKVIEERILMYSFVNDRFMPPDDPLGRNGPTLDQFLRKRPLYSDLQPCPYGKKCTYGNKCKFFHAERGNQPQKSITDTIKHYSSQKINEVRARGTSRDSSPGDPLIRTMSLQAQHQPDGSGTSMIEKQALRPTRSTNPRLTVTQPAEGGGHHQQLQQLVAPPNVFWPPPGPSSTSAITPHQHQHPQIQHAVSLGPPFLTSTTPTSIAGGEQYNSKSFSSESAIDTSSPSQLWQKRFSLGPELGQLPDTSMPPPPDTSMPPPPDTSMPPPPPRSPWGAPMPGSPRPPTTTTMSVVVPPPPAQSAVSDGLVGNAHRKLARQLTLNPTYDPRIHRGLASTVSFPFPPPTTTSAAAIPLGTAIPHPSSLSIDQHHVAVTRIASAPEQPSRYQQQMMPRKNHQDNRGSFVSNHGGHIISANQLGKEDDDASAISACSDTQLHKAFSDAAIGTSWKASAEGAAAATAAAAAAAAAVSPLIGSSDGVWETATSSSTAGQASSDYSEARSKLYYHLAAVFPEDQVLLAMRVMPEETDPQKICSYILCLNQQQQQR